MDGSLELRTDWLAASEVRLPEIVELRRAIHADPEIGLQCPRTSEKIKAALSGLPLEFREGTSTTGFVAILRPSNGGNGRTVLLRGDMDALPMQEETGLPFASRTPGAMHACGHDAHTAMLVGAAKSLCERRDHLAGTVMFMFQPGEEGWHGARYMMEDGLLDEPRPDAAFALHISPNLPRGVFASRPGPLMASADVLSAVIHGRGGHAAMPHEGLDPVPVACEIVTALQTFIARQIPVFDPAVLTIAKITAGTTDNVIPSRAELLGTLRTLSEQTRAKALEGFRRIVEHVALADGMTAEAHVQTGFPVTMNDARATETMRRAAMAIGGEAAWRVVPSPMMGAEDFSYVLQQVPGAMSFLGVAPEGSDPATNFPLHNTRMVIDEAMMARGIAMHCAVAEDFLNVGFD